MRYLMIAVLALVLVAPASAQLIFKNNFESGTFCGWSYPVFGVSDCEVEFEFTAYSTNPHANEAIADYAIDFRVWNATDTRICIPNLMPRQSTPDQTAGIVYRLETSTDTPYTYGVASAALVAYGTVTGDTTIYDCVQAGASRDFTLQVSLDNELRQDNPGTVAGYYKIQIVSVAYDEDGILNNGNETLVASGFSTFETPLVLVQNHNL